ncbi:MAG: IstB-like ATP-binding domain-containing protein [Nitrospira sp.]|nr:IstB-like ATP-binding domain-containing protein [Nitrospira sp.]MCW5778561.1 IstB-like ATP-binding domain-containing protein [Nitrospira sp.]
MPDVQRLSFEERLGLLVDRERTMQENRRLTRRLAQARLPDRATLEDLDYRHPRGHRAGDRPVDSQSRQCVVLAPISSRKTASAVSPRIH